MKILNPIHVFSYIISMNIIQKFFSDLVLYNDTVNKPPTTFFSIRSLNDLYTQLIQIWADETSTPDSWTFSSMIF